MKNQLKFYMFISLVFLLVFTKSLSAQTINQDININESKSQKFIRIKRENKKPVAVQSANVSYVPIGGIPDGMRVDLISAVHIADENYYQKLNELFKNYDLVLYESVSNAKKVTTKPEALKNKRPANFVSQLQTSLADSLNLSFQKNVIDYTPENFVHADLSPSEFFEKMDENGESFLGWGLNAIIQSLKQKAKNPAFKYAFNARFLMALTAPDSEKELKLFAAQFFFSEEPFASLQAFEGENGSTLITSRNEKALKVLRQEIEKGNKTFAIFYGAGHFPEMEKSLIKEFKLKKDKVNWIDAWDLK